MKLVIFSLTVAVAALTSSCQSIPTSGNALNEQAGCAVNLPSDAPVELKKGMSKQDVLSALGNPSYQYAISEKETWVYEECNLLLDKAKETALNMVPVVGPAASLYMGLKPNVICAEAAVTFDCEGKVICFYQTTVCPEK